MTHNMYRDLIAPDFKGAAYVLQNDKVVIEYADGYRDFANELPNTIDTKFASASAGKVFVAVGILQLIETGKINFDDTLEKLIPMDWKSIDPQITVEQLLNHTSGIPDHFDETVMSEYEELWVDYPNYKIRQNEENFWKGLLDGKLLSKDMTTNMLKKHSGEGDDPGVSFISEYNPNKNMIAVYVSNYCDNVWKIARDIRNA